MPIAMAEEDEAAVDADVEERAGDAKGAVKVGEGAVKVVAEEEVVAADAVKVAAVDEEAAEVDAAVVM